MKSDSMLRHRLLALGLLCLAMTGCGGGGGGGTPAGDDTDPPQDTDFSDDPVLKSTGFTHFESGPVRPLALSSDGLRLYAVNTPDNRLEVFDVSGATPLPLASIPVGLEPVAVALRDDGEAWVVNQLSDSISIVDLASTPARVRQTLWVGDEPRDIVFAGGESKRAFITAAHRG